CACYRFVIVDGIVDLRQIPPLTPDDVARFETFLRAKDEEGALTFALAANYRAPSPRVSSQRILDYLERGRIPLTREIADRSRSNKARILSRQADISFRQTLELLYPKRHAAYFFQRYANPSFLAAHALLALLRELPRLKERASLSDTHPDNRKTNPIRVLDL